MVELTVLSSRNGRAIAAF